MARPVELYEFVGRGRSHLLQVRTSSCPAPLTRFAPPWRSIRRMRRRTPGWLARAARRPDFVGAAPGGVRGGEGIGAARTGHGPQLRGRAGRAGQRSVFQRVGLAGRGAKPVPGARINPDYTEALLLTGRCRRRSGDSTRACGSNSRRSRAIRDRRWS